MTHQRTCMAARTKSRARRPEAHSRPLARLGRRFCFLFCRGGSTPHLSRPIPTFGRRAALGCSCEAAALGLGTGVPPR
jgi:hypothetical protein